MAATDKGKISYRLLGKMSNLVICSRCLRDGVVTPVPQLISGRHSLTNQCAECRSRTVTRHDQRQRTARLLTLSK